MTEGVTCFHECIHKCIYMYLSVHVYCGLYSFSKFSIVKLFSKTAVPTCAIDQQESILNFGGCL